MILKVLYLYMSSIVLNVFQLQEMCAQYWPGPRNRRGKTYAEFSVHTIEQQHNTGYTTRKMGVTDSRVSGEEESLFWGS